MIGDPIQELSELINRGDQGELRRYFRALLASIKKQDLEYILKIFSEKMDRRKRRALCPVISESGGILELWDEKIEILASFLSEFCGQSYLVDFEIWLKHGATMRKRITDTRLLEMVGGKVLRIIEYVLNPDFELDLDMIDVLEEKMSNEEKMELEKVISLISRDTTEKERKLIRFAEILRFYLDKQVLLYRKEFKDEIKACLMRVPRPLTYEKSFLTAYVFSFISRIDEEYLLTFLKLLALSSNSLMGGIHGLTMSLYRHALSAFYRDILVAHSGLWEALGNHFQMHSDEFLLVIESLKARKFDFIEGLIVSLVVDYIYDYLERALQTEILKALTLFLKKAPKHVLDLASKIVKKGEVDKEKLETCFRLIKDALLMGVKGIENHLTLLVRDLTLYISPNVASGFLSEGKNVFLLLEILSMVNSFVLASEIVRFIKMFSVAGIVRKSSLLSRYVPETNILKSAINNLNSLLGESETQLLINLLDLEE